MFLTTLYEYLFIIFSILTNIYNSLIYTTESKSDSDADYRAPVEPKPDDLEAVKLTQTYRDWKLAEAKERKLIKEIFCVKPVTIQCPFRPHYCFLKVQKPVKEKFYIRPGYTLPLIWSRNPHTKVTLRFYSYRVKCDLNYQLNHQEFPPDRISLWPFSVHILKIASHKIPCDLEHNWSSLLPSKNFRWPCGCKRPVNALWENDDTCPFPKSNTSGWVSEPIWKTPFEVLPKSIVSNKISTRPYKRRKTMFSDRKGNR